LLKNVKSERTPLLKRYLSIPILLSPERDDTLSKLTDNRVSAFSHDLVSAGFASVIFFFPRSSS
jgi:hypothetical protein